MKECKVFTVILSFDLDEFHEDKLTKEYVESVVKSKLGSRGVEIRVYNGKKFTEGNENEAFLG